MGAIVEADEDFGWGDDWEQVMTSVVPAASATVAKIEAYGSCSCWVRLGAVVAVRPTSAADGKWMKSHMESADGLMLADRDLAIRWRMSDVLPVAVGIGWGHASKPGCYFVCGQGTGRDSVTADTMERSHAVVWDVIVVVTGLEDDLTEHHCR